MTGEFTTSGALEVSVDERSLRDARQTIQDELGDVTVQVESSSSTSSSLSNRTSGASKERAMSRQLLNDQQDTLVEAREGIDDLVPMAEERNDLLRMLLEQQQEGDFVKAKKRGGGSSGGLMGGALVAGALAAGLGSSLVSFLEANFAWPDIPPVQPPNIPPLKAPDLPELDAPNIPPLKVPNLPPLKAPDAPTLKLPEMPTLDVDAPTLDVDAPTLNVDAPTLDVKKPNWIPIPVQSPTGSPDGNGSPGGNWMPDLNLSPEQIAGGVLGGGVLAGGMSALWSGAGGAAGAAAGGSAGVGFPVFTKGMMSDDGGVPWKNDGTSRALLFEAYDAWKDGRRMGSETPNGTRWDPLDQGNDAGNSKWDAYRPGSDRMTFAPWTQHSGDTVETIQRARNRDSDVYQDDIRRRRTNAFGRNRADEARDRRQSTEINVEFSPQIDASSLRDLRREMERKLDDLERKLERLERA